jgi:hypothetical protein
LEWILAPKSVEETTADDFTDLMQLKFDHRVKKGGLNLLAAYNARSTGFSNV